MKTLLTVTLAIVGAVIGFFVAGAGTYYGCLLMDKIEGNTPGNGYMTVGWIFWFFTIPVGTAVGIASGIFFSKIILKKKEPISETENTPALKNEYERE